jgi:hypothetical protein
VMVTNCPVCEAEQNFKHKQTFVGSTQWGNLNEVYISCTHCPFRQHIRYTTPEVERISKDMTRQKAELTRQRHEFGEESDIVKRMLNKLQTELDYELEILRLMVHDRQHDTN